MNKSLTNQCFLLTNVPQLSQFCSEFSFHYTVQNHNNDRHKIWALRKKEFVFSDTWMIQMSSLSFLS